MKLADVIRYQALQAGGPGSGRHAGDGEQATKPSPFAKHVDRLEKMTPGSFAQHFYKTGGGEGASVMRSASGAYKIDTGGKSTPVTKDDAASASAHLIRNGFKQYAGNDDDMRNPMSWNNFTNNPH